MFQNAQDLTSVFRASESRRWAYFEFLRQRYVEEWKSKMEIIERYKMNHGPLVKVGHTFEHIDPLDMVVTENYYDTLDALSMADLRHERCITMTRFSRVEQIYDAVVAKLT